MNEWWDGLSLLLKVLYCIAFPSTLILLVQTLLSMFGFHDGGSGHDFSDTSGLDLDVDTNISGHGDVDIGHCTHDIGCDHNVDGGNPADFASMRMFTLQTIVAFFTVFSWSSIVLVSSRCLSSTVYSYRLCSGSGDHASCSKDSSTFCKTC